MLLQRLIFGCRGDVCPQNSRVSVFKGGLLVFSRVHAFGPIFPILRDRGLGRQAAGRHMDAQLFSPSTNESAGPTGRVGRCVLLPGIILCPTPRLSVPPPR